MLTLLPFESFRCRRVVSMILLCHLASRDVVVRFVIFCFFSLLFNWFAFTSNPKVAFSSLGTDGNLIFVFFSSRRA